MVGLVIGTYVVGRSKSPILLRCLYRPNPEQVGNRVGL